jgi:hypothetical protein
VQPNTVTRVPYNLDNARVVYEALRAAGIDFVTFLPDSGTYPIQQLMAADPAVTTCSAPAKTRALPSRWARRSPASGP